MFLVSEVRGMVRSAHNLAAMYEPIVQTLWEPYHLTTQ
jgi:hypothetical protein